MDIEAYRNYCLNKKGVTESFPFDDKILVYKVMDKIFALTDINEFASINLKCDPILAIEYRETYAGVTPGYHMNKKHWNTIAMDGSIPDNLVYRWIDDSYNLVVAQLPLAVQKELLETK
jgi:predicted DNA-binding protein (MmcQ/YjbR family)